MLLVVHHSPAVRVQKWCMKKRVRRVVGERVRPGRERGPQGGELLERLRRHREERLVHVERQRFSRERYGVTDAAHRQRLDRSRIERSYVLVRQTARDGRHQAFLHEGPKALVRVDEEIRAVRVRDRGSELGAIGLVRDRQELDGDVGVRLLVLARGALQRELFIATVGVPQHDPVASAGERREQHERENRERGRKRARHLFSFRRACAPSPDRRDESWPDRRRAATCRPSADAWHRVLRAARRRVDRSR